MFDLSTDAKRLPKAGCSPAPSFPLAVSLGAVSAATWVEGGSSTETVRFIGG